MPRLDAAAIRAEADALELRSISLLEDTWADRVPHAEFDRLRREPGLFWHDEPDGPGFWVVSRHEDLVAVSRDHQTWSSELGSVFVKDQPEEDLLAMRLSILNMDEPRHNRVRRLISAGFTPRQIRRLREEIDNHARAIVTRLRDRERIDFVHEISCRVPMEMICEMTGVPDADWEQMYQWSDRLIGDQDPEFCRTRDDRTMAAAEIFLYCNELVAKRREQPADDILSDLVHAEVDGDRLTTEELNLFFVTLIVAGNETTRNLISHGWLALLEHPEQYAMLRDSVRAGETELLDLAADEMLRWGSSIQNFRRTALVDTELAGTSIRAGDKLVMYYLSANYDETVFEDPYAFRVDRAPNNHVTFGGGGAHFCLGSHLAKAEIASVTREVLLQLDDIVLDGEPDRLRSDFVNGLKRLPVRYTARPDVDLPLVISEPVDA